MNEKFKKIAEDFKYGNINQADIIDKVDSSELLYVLMYNYNWDDGFEIPYKALNNKFCELSTALMIFDLAGGIDFLFDREGDVKDEWYAFVSKLYNDIMHEKYPIGDILFEPQLSRIQEFKLRKILDEKELVFIGRIGKNNLDILV